MPVLSPCIEHVRWTEAEMSDKSSPRHSVLGLEPLELRPSSLNYLSLCASFPFTWICRKKSRRWSSVPLPKSLIPDRTLVGSSIRKKKYLCWMTCDRLYALKHKAIWPLPRIVFKKWPFSHSLKWQQGVDFLHSDWQQASLIIFLAMHDRSTSLQNTSGRFGGDYFGEVCQ